MLPARQRLGDFEIVSLLGKGGMGEVYEAQQLNPPRRVALKVLPAWLAQDEGALRARGRRPRRAGPPRHRTRQDRSLRRLGVEQKQARRLNDQ